MRSQNSFEGTRHVLRLAIGYSLAASALLLSQSVGAATTTGVMTVTASVSATCTVVASTLAFPNANSAAIKAGNIDATGTVSVICTTGWPYTVSLDAGVGTGATIASRKMLSGLLPLSYSVYTSAARTTVWGDGTTTSGTMAGTGNGAEQSIPTYGRIFAGQVVPAAAYSDTIKVTVTY